MDWAVLDLTGERAGRQDGGAVSCFQVFETRRYPARSRDLTGQVMPKVTHLVD